MFVAGAAGGATAAGCCVAGASVADNMAGSTNASGSGWDTTCNSKISLARNLIKLYVLLLGGISLVPLRPSVLFVFFLVPNWW